MFGFHGKDLGDVLDVYLDQVRGFMTVTTSGKYYGILLLSFKHNGEPLQPACHYID